MEINKSSGVNEIARTCRSELSLPDLPAALFVEADSVPGRRGMQIRDTIRRHIQELSQII
jgi:hypothetical protein